MLARDLRQRILSKQRIVTIVALGRGPLGRVLQPRLIKLFEQRILPGHAIGYRRHLPKRRRYQSEKKPANNGAARATAT